ncbi:MAG: D-sedoheptulose 7-phosphate isomerase, partial [Deltaproteobacteria bacterium]|nr:D-sedoheptulose 7-phosphate isomerase [Deltaproteobacteria bacterium]
MKNIVAKCLDDSQAVKQILIRDGVEKIIKAAELIATAFKEGKKLLIFGNGGSAADAQHVAAEFVNRFLMERPPLPAIALTTDSSILTSVGNDYHFDEIFSKQVSALGSKGDVAWGISTSGKSRNVILALQVARERGLTTLALTGEDAGHMAPLVDLVIDVPSRHTPRIQEAHLMVEHLICELVDYQLFHRIKET